MPTTKHFSKHLKIAATAAFALTAVLGTAQEQWTPPQTLNHYSFQDNPGHPLANFDIKPKIATDNNGTWLGMWITDSGTGDLKFARSTDNGATWDEPSMLDVELSPPTDPSDPFLLQNDHIVSVDLVYAGDGAWVCIWHAVSGIEFGVEEDVFSHVYKSRSTDGGLTWSEPMQFDAGGEFIPVSSSALAPNPPTLDIAADGTGNLVAIWMYALEQEQPFGIESSTAIVRSDDYGQTWSAPEQISMLAGEIQNPGNSRITYTTEGNLALAYLIYKGMGEEPVETIIEEWYVATSADNGAHWSVPGFLFETSLPLHADLDSGLDINALGNTVVMSGLTPFVCTSTDGGTTFSEPLLLNNEGTTPGFGVDLSRTTSDTWVLSESVPYNQSLVNIWRSTDPETTWTKEQLIMPKLPESAPDIAGGSENIFVGLFSKANASAFVNKRDTDIYAFHSPESATTWTEPISVLPDPSIESIWVDGFQPSVASGGDTLLAVWKAAGPISNVAGGEYTDVMIARSNNSGFTWQPAFNIPDSDIDSPFKIVHTDADNWLVHYSPQYVSPVAPYSAQYIVSSDDGETWSSPGTIEQSVVASDHNGIMIGADPDSQALFKSTDNGASWQQVATSSADFTHIAHAEGSNWFAFNAFSEIYTSVNGGNNWTFLGFNANLHSIDVQKFESDHNGTLVAVGLRKIDPLKIETYALISKDSGNSWSPPLLVHTEHYATIDPELVVADLQVKIDVLNLSPDQWHIYLRYTLLGREVPFDSNHPVERTLYKAVSRDGGNSLSPAEQIDIEDFLWMSDETRGVDGILDFGLKPLDQAAFAASGGNVVAVWPGLLFPDYPDESIAANGEDNDIIYRVFTTPTAARDWQLFE